MEGNNITGITKTAKRRIDNPFIVSARLKEKKDAFKLFGLDKRAGL